MYLGLKNNKPVGWSNDPIEGYIEVSQEQYDFASLNPDCVWDGEKLVNPAIEPVKEYVPTYRELRAREYPPVSEYIDGVVKGDQTQIDKYIADCLAVKAKYPKPL